MHLVRPHRAGPGSCYCRRRSHGCGRGNSDCDFRQRRRQKRTESGMSEFGYRNPSMGRTFVQGWSSAQLTCPTGGARRAFRQQSDHGCCVSLYSAAQAARGTEAMLVDRSPRPLLRPANFSRCTALSGGRRNHCCRRRQDRARRFPRPRTAGGGKALGIP